MRISMVLWFLLSGVAVAQDAYKCKVGGSMVIQSQSCGKEAIPVRSVSGGANGAAPPRMTGSEAAAVAQWKNEVRNAPTPGDYRASRNYQAEAVAKKAECDALERQYDQSSSSAKWATDNKASQDERSRIIDRRNQLRC